MKSITEIRTRSRRPKVADPITDYSSVKDLTETVVSVESYFEDQNNAYKELGDLRNDTDDEKIVLVSGIVEKAEDVEADIEWASETLNLLYTQKKDLYKKNINHYLGYEFKTFTKPTVED